MSGDAAVGLALGRVAPCPELRPAQRPGGRQADLSARRDEPYDAVVASLLPAPLRKRRHGVIPAKGGADAGARSARTPGAACAFANSRPPTRLLGGRPSSPTSRRSPRHDHAPWATCRDPCRAGGRTVLLAMACGRRPLGRSAPAASEASPDVSTDRRSGMTSCAPLPSGAGRSEATTALCGSSYWQDGLACRPPGLGFGSTLRAVSAESIGRVPCRAGTARAAR